MINSSPATWNSISTSVKNCSSLYSIKCHLKSHLITQLINNQLHTPSGHLATARASNSCLMLDYVRVINFLLLFSIIIIIMVMVIIIITIIL